MGVSRPQQLRSEDNLDELMSPPSIWAPVIKLRAPISSWRQGLLPAELSLWPLLGFLRPGFVIQPQAGLYPLAFLIPQLPGVQKSQACTIIPYSALLKILCEELEIQWFEEGKKTNLSLNCAYKAIGIILKYKKMNWLCALCQKLSSLYFLQKSKSF